MSKPFFCNTNKQVDSTGKNCESYGVSEQNKGSLLTIFCFSYEEYDFFTVMFKSLNFTVLNTFLDFLLCWFLVLKWDDSAIFPSLFFYCLRMATCKDRESVVSEPFGESLIFLAKIPLGRLFSKIIFKIFRDFFYFWNVWKLQSRCSFWLIKCPK